MTDDQSANFPLIVSRNAAWSAFGDALRLYVGRGRQFTVKRLSNASGVKDRVIECAMCAFDSQDWRPMPFECQLSIASVIGPEFSSEWLAKAQQGAFSLPDDDLPPGLIAADNSDDNATLTRAAIDGKFDRDEAPDLKVVGVRMVARGAQIVKQARGA